MDIRELQWLRAYSSKLDPELRSLLITNYRAVLKKPCFLQKFFRFFQNKFSRYPVIIQLAPTRDYDAINELRTTLTKSHRPVEDLKIINSFSASLSSDDIKNISNNTLVAKIYLDREIRALLDIVNQTIKTSWAWQKNFTGKGVTIAILDTGTYPHPDLLLPQNRVIAFKDFVNNENSSLYDDNGHGTHCAGSAAGNGYTSSGKYKGPAYEANIVSIKILDKKGTGKSSTAIKAVEWILAHKKQYNIKIISLSLGYKAVGTYRQDPVCQALEKAWEAGLVICTAAGNDGPDPQTISSPGIHPAFITIGASDDHNTVNQADDSVADFSGRGPTIDGLTKPDFLLPGNNIVSARAKGSFLDKLPGNTIVDDWYLNLSGTSMAVPICAGIIAQMLEAQPVLTPEEIKGQLIKSCHRLENADANTQGNGFLDCSMLFKEAQTS